MVSSSQTLPTTPSYGSPINDPVSGLSFDTADPAKLSEALEGLWERATGGDPKSAKSSGGTILRRLIDNTGRMGARVAGTTDPSLRGEIERQLRDYVGMVFTARDRLIAVIPPPTPAPAESTAEVKQGFRKSEQAILKTQRHTPHRTDAPYSTILKEAAAHRSDGGARAPVSTAPPRPEPRRLSPSEAVDLSARLRKVKERVGRLAFPLQPNNLDAVERELEAVESALDKLDAIGTENVEPPPQLAAKPPAPFSPETDPPFTRTVQGGDTLWDIVSRFVAEKAGGFSPEQKIRMVNEIISDLNSRNDSELRSFGFQEGTRALRPGMRLDFSTIFESPEFLESITERSVKEPSNGSPLTNPSPAEPPFPPSRTVVTPDLAPPPQIHDLRKVSPQTTPVLEVDKQKQGPGFEISPALIEHEFHSHMKILFPPSGLLKRGGVPENLAATSAGDILQGKVDHQIALTRGIELADVAALVPYLEEVERKTGLLPRQNESVESYVKRAIEKDLKQRGGGRV